ncbi:hypothetical protein LB515_23630 [Mesorhizobium sp. CA15]|uniref:hypothetical protein n=1 Tax=Mesorhizobium sp. CA15 TaxID=2876641 RepID=UPI001CD08DB9|nr:hypothetical protein [Mesorhizobium sp. CA15]MBZ9868374.1 hypothetical protein [Mesorhizobium sp. CA15]
MARQRESGFGHCLSLKFDRRLPAVGRLSQGAPNSYMLTENTGDFMSYAIATCPDDVERLRTLLHSLGEEGSRIINVIWQPERDIRTEDGEFRQPSGYVIVLEYSS